MIIISMFCAEGKSQLLEETTGMDQDGLGLHQTPLSTASDESMTINLLSIHRKTEKLEVNEGKGPAYSCKPSGFWHLKGLQERKIPDSVETRVGKA